MRAALALVFLLALALRVLPLPTVFTSEGILPGSLNDEFYHLRRIVYSVVRFPEVLSFDPYVNFPDGGAIHWPAGFDWLVAALARALVGAGDRHAIETVAVWVPPVLGALTAVGVAAVGRAASGRAAGITAGVVFALLPASWVFSRLGVVDHHVGVALAGVVLLGLAMAWLRAASGRPGAALSAALGLVMGLPLLAWPGFLLHVGLTQLGLLAATLGATDREVAARRARSLAGAHALAALVVLPFGLGESIAQYGAWSPLVLSRFQPTWLGAAAALLVLAALAWSHPAVGRGLPRRIGVAVGMGGLGVGLALLLAPGLREALLDASGWFTQAEEARQVQELQPLDAGTAASRYSLAFFLVPLAWVPLGLAAWRGRRADLGMLLLWATSFLALALLQRRFNNSLAAPYALVWGVAASKVPALVRRRLAGRRVPAGVAVPVATLLVALLLVPSARFYWGHLRLSLAALDRPEPALRLARPIKRVHLGAAAWLARATPPTRGYLDASLRPEYGVLSSWGIGHLVRYRAERPLVQDNFGAYGGRENFERAWSYYASTDEEAAVDLLDRLEVRYVVATRNGAGQSPEAYGPLTMTRRLAHLFGSAARTRDRGREVEIPALVRHRLVYHARSAPGKALRADPPQLAVAVYERVEGARVVGAAPPGAEVEARLRITTRAGPRHLPRAREVHVYRSRTRADASGRYALRLPYPTDRHFSDAVRVVGRYEVAIPEHQAPLAVPEAAVRSGATVPGPHLAPGAREAASAGAERSS